MRKNRIIPFVIIAIISFLGLFWQSKKAEINSFNNASFINYADVAWLLTASCLVLLMTPGLSFFYGGMVGKKNVISTMLKSFICLGVISLIWVLVGFSLSFGSSIGFSINGIHYGIFGNPLDFAFFDQVELLPHKALGNYPFYPFCSFSNEICSNYASNYHRSIGRKDPFCFLFVIYFFVYNIYLRSFMPHGLASKRIAIKLFWCKRFCWRNSRSYECWICGISRSFSIRKKK